MERRINGHTGLLALFGTPVGHSGSPAMYNFSFQHDGLDYAYMAFDVNVEQMPAVFDSIRLFKMRGGNFTMPCKNIAAELVDKLMVLTLKVRKLLFLERAELLQQFRYSLH